MNLQQALKLERAVRWFSLAALLGLVVYLLVAKPVDLAHLWRTLKTLPSLLWLQLLGLAILCYVFRFLRWKSFVEALGAVVPWPKHVAIYMAGFVSGLTLGKAGEAIRAIYLKPYGLGYVDCLGVCFVDRLLDLVGVALLAGLAFGLLGEHTLWAWSAMGLFLAVMLLFRSRVLGFLVSRVPMGRLNGVADQGLRTTSVLLTGASLGRGLSWSLLSWVTQGMCLHITLLAMGHSLAWYEVVGIYAVGLLAGAVTFLPGGFGAGEAAMTWLLSLKGVPVTEALVGAVVARGLPLWLGLAAAGAAMGWLSLNRRAVEQGDAES